MQTKSRTSIYIQPCLHTVTRTLTEYVGARIRLYTTKTIISQTILDFCKPRIPLSLLQIRKVNFPSAKQDKRLTSPARITPDLALGAATQTLFPRNRYPISDDFFRSPVLLHRHTRLSALVYLPIIRQTLKKK